MESAFWHERWQKQEIGFHQQAGNAAMRRAVDALAPGDNTTVFVPLCGKSVDMAWLHQRGCQVRGVELSPSALESFFAEQGLAPEITSVTGGLQRFLVAGYELYAGDFFALDPEHLGRVDVVCDRAALVALPAPMRERYAARLLQLAPGAPIVLVTLDYAPEEMSGPPFAVSDAEVERLFAEHRQLSRLESREVITEESGLRKRGLSSLRETAWLLRPLA